MSWFAATKETKAPEFETSKTEPRPLMSKAVNQELITNEENSYFTPTLIDAEMVALHNMRKHEMNLL